MIANALIVALAVLLAGAFWLMSELRFLVPYRRLLIHDYGNLLLLAAGIFFVNVFAAVYAIERRFFLKDTGRKLSYIETQALVGDSSLPYPETLPEAD
jgi:hypothetical protein